MVRGSQGHGSTGLESQDVTTNLDWLRVMVDAAKWRCSQRDRPRKWRLMVDFLVEWPDDIIEECARGVEVSEPDIVGSNPREGRDDRIIELLPRLASARTALLLEVEGWSTTGQIDGREYRDLMPPARFIEAVARLSAVEDKSDKAAQHARKTFERDCVIVPMPPWQGDEDGKRWAIRHKPTGIALFFFVPFDADEKAVRALADKTLDSLGEAVGRKMQERQLMNRPSRGMVN